ncbi:unnamed protein product [Polarella glacialis]|uniref:Uncharacterized protein n=2 Tax=Polarella glacialis TaxID=89957 RepID=A0A813I9U9_POLGL|nr:unnamed protein product [Polarella glacialis]
MTAAMKRPAAASAVADSKVSKKAKATGGRNSVASAIAQQCKDVAASLKTAEGYPSHVLAMLGDNVQHCLGVVKEERHSFQEQVIAMVGEVLGSVQNGIDGKIQAAETKVGEADSEKANRAAAAEGAAALVETRTASSEAATTELALAAGELKAALEALKVAEQEQKTGDAELVAAGAKKERYEAATVTFSQIKEGTMEAKAAAKALADLGKLGKDLAFDTALLTSLPAALSKEPAARGNFDQLVITQIESELQKHVAAVTGILEAGAPEREVRAAKVTAAKSVADVAAVRETACKDALKDAQAAQKEAEKTQTAAIKAVKLFGSEMKQVATDLQEAKDSLQEFQSGPMAAFQDLLARSSAPPPAPPAPPVEEAPAAEAPAAEAPAAPAAAAA